MNVSIMKKDKVITEAKIALIVHVDQINSAELKYDPNFILICTM